MCFVCCYDVFVFLSFCNCIFVLYICIVYNVSNAFCICYDLPLIIVVVLSFCNCIFVLCICIVYNVINAFCTCYDLPLIIVVVVRVNKLLSGLPAQSPKSRSSLTYMCDCAYDSASSCNH